MIVVHLSTISVPHTTEASDAAYDSTAFMML